MASVSEWIACLKQGEAEAAQKLWDRYAVRLVELAHRKLGSAPRGMADEEDIAQSVFRSICRGAEAGRFQHVKNRDDLWWLLLAITKQKAVDHIRRETALKRGAGRVHNESAMAGVADAENRMTLDHLVGVAPTPEFLVSLDEQQQRLLGLLRNDDLRQIANARIEGYTVAEIAAELTVSTRSVERKLRLIRNRWSQDLGDGERTFET